jgi:integrase
MDARGEVMTAAGISGPHATPKGLRHGFGVRAVTGEKPVPLNMVKKWLGHADLKTTAIYVDAVGAEEDQLAERMWSRAHG